ncbi:phosphonoacetate hydrolase [Rhodovibrionaceae bacterium A322]
MSKQDITVNNRTYPWPKQPLVVVCIDGSEPDYIEKAVAAGQMPYTEKMLARGADLRAHCVVPSFTNPNNLSIVTGQPPAVHGISGNFFLDPDSGEEVMMNDPKFLRAGTIFAAFEAAGAKVAVVTAKDKLRRLLGNGLSFGQGGSICFSSEKSDEADFTHNGIEKLNDLVGKPVPSVYSADLSEFVFAAGVKVMEEHRPDLMYLSTTDYVQHKHAPGTAEANAFYAMMDSYWAQLDALGCTLALTADHGMSAKHNEGGEPNVIYLQDHLDGLLGDGESRVILPITDPYVVHHGALGGYATAYLPEGCDVPGLLEELKGVDGVETAVTQAEACERFGLPADRLGDIVVISQEAWALGSSPARHDLSALKEPLRSHGGLSEQTVPLIFNQPVANLPEGHQLRNFDIFHVALNNLTGSQTAAAE